MKRKKKKCVYGMGQFFHSYFPLDVFLGSELGNTELPMDILDATIISSNFWPPIQVIICRSIVSLLHIKTLLFRIS